MSVTKTPETFSLGQTHSEYLCPSAHAWWDRSPRNLPISQYTVTPHRWCPPPPPHPTHVCIRCVWALHGCVVSGQGWSWSGALTAFSGKGTGYCSLTHTDTHRVVERGKGRSFRKWDWGKEGSFCLLVCFCSKKVKKKVILWKLCAWHWFPNIELDHHLYLNHDKFVS